MKRALYLRLLGWLQRKCKHPPESVTADMLEGMGRDVEVLHCRICGAVRAAHYGGRMMASWRTPRPDWEIETPSPPAQGK